MPQVVNELQKRLADLDAATSIHDLLVGNPQKVPSKEKKYDYFSINLTMHHHLIFRLNHQNPPVLDSGEVDWNKVRRVKIIEIKHSGDDC